MLAPVFTFKLNQKIVPRLVTVGRYDGKHPCLTAATSGGKVFVHSPHHKHGLQGSGGGRLTASSTDTDIQLLSIGQQITAIATGRLDPTIDRDILIIGTQTTLLAYDIQENKDLFYKELPDGANAIVVGELGESGQTLAFVGGNCSIQGFDHTGEDRFWTVTGDYVCSLALCDFDGDGSNELIVGSEDFDVRVFKNDELLTEFSEADSVVSLCPVSGDKFGYALANGIVGLYSGLEREWRIKSKNQPICLHTFDVRSNGDSGLVTGWSSGKIDVRRSHSGEVMFKDSFPSHVAGIVQADYRGSGKVELICCSVDGEVRGYLATTDVQGGGTVEGEKEGVRQEHWKQLELLTKRKQNLLLELKNFEASEKISKSKDPQAEISQGGRQMGVIPAGTLLRTEFSAFLPNSGSGGASGDKLKAGGNKLTPHIELSVEATNGTVIKTVVIFAEGLFDGESHIVHPLSTKLSSVVKIPLLPDKDSAVDLSIQAFVGHTPSTQFHVFEATRHLPRFSLYIPCPLATEPPPQGRVTFNLHERLETVTSWLNDSFMYGAGEDAVLTPLLHVAYLSLRTSFPVILSFNPAQNGAFTIETDDLDLAGDIVQSLASYLDLQDLTVTASFPQQMKELRDILEKVYKIDNIHNQMQVEEYYKIRQKLTAEMADNSALIRNLVVRAEDARIMNDMGNMKKAYTQLYQLNRDLMLGYTIRSNNHLELLECLRIVNQAIQKTANLRVGKPKAQLISACRAAIKSKDNNTLIKTMMSSTT